MLGEPKAFHHFKTKPQEASRAVGLNTVFYVAQDLLQLVTMLILVRILLPEDYAIFALVLTTHGLVGAFGHQSFIAHSLQVDVKEGVNYDVYMTFSGLIQLFCFCVCNLVAYFYEGSGDIENLSLLLHVLSITFLVEWFSELIYKVYERNESWQRRRTLQLISSVILSIVSILLAVFGFGIWSLIIPTLLQHVIFLYDLFVYHQWRFRWRIDWEEYKEAWIFGWHRIGSLLLQRLRLWVEPWLLLKFLTLADLGFFTRGLGLAQLIVFRVCVTLMLTIFPYISKLRLKKESTQNTNNQLIFYNMLIVVPLSIGLACHAPFVTALVYGDDWREVSDLLSPLSIICGLNGMIYVLSSLSLANQNFRIPVVIDLLLLGVHLSPLILSSYFSVGLYLEILLGGYLLCMLICLSFLHFNLRILNIRYLFVVFFKILVCCLPILVLNYYKASEFSVSMSVFFEITILAYSYLLLARFMLYSELSGLITKLSRYKASLLIFVK